MITAHPRFGALMDQPGVNFISILGAAFAPVDPKSVKRYWQLDWILTLLGARGVGAVRKYVGKIEGHIVYKNCMAQENQVIGNFIILI